MLQLAYFSIMLSSYSHAFIGPLQEWSYINGYNKVKVNIAEAQLVGNDFWILGYEDFFFINVNAMVFACLTNYFVALILFGLSMLSDRSTSRKLKNSAIFFAVDIGFALLVFSINNIAVSIALEAFAGHIFSFTYGLNKFFILLVLLMFIGQIGAYFYKIHEINDSQLFYHRNKNYCHFYPFIFLLRNLVVIVFIILTIFIQKISPGVVVGIEGAYLIAIAAGRPYKSYIDYARFLAV